MADYRLGRTLPSLPSSASEQPRGRQHESSKVGHSVAFKTRRDTAEYVHVGEAEGFIFEGRSFCAGVVRLPRQYLANAKEKSAICRLSLTTP